MENKLESIRHCKTVLDSQFSVLFEEYREFGDNEVLNEIFQMANQLFALAEEFGYREWIETEIYKHHHEKL